MREKVGVLFSGGVESSALLYHYLRKGFLVYPLYVRCGLPWEETERLWADRLWARLKRDWKTLMTIRTVPFRVQRKVRKRIGSLSDLEITLRNSSLILSALLKANTMGVRRLSIGSLGMYPFPDNRREFFESLQGVLRDGSGIDLSLETPFMGMEKEEVIAQTGDGFPFHLTFSCASPVKKHHCGRCVKCLERKEGFIKAGFKDPTLYFFNSS